MSVHEFIVVGSGATGSMAAQTLCENGSAVLLLDGGQRDERYAGAIADRSFVELRESDESQHRYFLGDRFEGILPGPVRTAAQLTPPRQFLIEGAERFLPVDSEDFLPMESLALGGLGSGWGLGCCVFSAPELQKAALPQDAMRDAYQVVASRIGISGADDDARPYTYDGLHGVQPALPMDPTAAALYAGYSRKRAALHAGDFSLGRPALALLSRDRDGRRASARNDMEFYSDAGQSAWRPWIAIERLRNNPRFTYAPNTLVTRFEEGEDGVRVMCLNMQTGQEVVHRCRTLVLASGTLGSARIVLRSMRVPGATLPLLCNGYSYVPCIVPSRIGRAMPDRNIGLCQLVLFHDPRRAGDDIAMASLYTYRSLLLFRILRESGLNFKDARPIMRYLLSGLIIMGIHHPESYGPEKFVRLDADANAPTGDRLHVRFRPAQAETDRMSARERGYMRAMRAMGAWPVKRLRPGSGSSIHYAGTLPFAQDGRPFTLDPTGRLGGTRNVYVADGSGFRYLPAKGLTLSLMANAHRVAHALARETRP